MGQNPVLVHKNTFKCIIYIQNVYILMQEVTGIISGITFVMAKEMTT